MARNYDLKLNSKTHFWTQNYAKNIDEFSRPLRELLNAQIEKRKSWLIINI